MFLITFSSFCSSPTIPVTTFENKTNGTLVYTINIKINDNIKKQFTLKHVNLPLGIEQANLFCTENNIYDRRCPLEIIYKVVVDNHLSTSEKQVVQILENKYFTLKDKLTAYKLDADTNTNYQNYRILSLINEKKCFATTSNINNIELSQIDTNAIKIKNITPKLTPTQIEYNELFGFLSFYQYDIRNAIKCYGALVIAKPYDAVYNFNYGALLENIGNHTESIYYLSAAAKQKYFPAAIALGKLAAGSFNFTMNKFYLNLARNAAKSKGEKILISIRNATLLPSIYMSQIDYANDMKNSVILLKNILENQLTQLINNVEEKEFLSNNNKFVEYALYGALFDQCTHHNPHSNIVIEAKRLLSNILRHLLPAGNFVSIVDDGNDNYNKDKNTNDKNKMVEIRIGFATSFFRDHSVAKYTCPLMKKLKDYYGKNNKNDTTRFFIVGIGIGGKSHPGNKFTNEHHNVAFKNCRDSTNLYIYYQEGATNVLFKKIRSLKLDILIYPEIGLNAAVYLMSLVRLAPIQIAHLGNAVTHGINTIDYTIHSLKFLPGTTLNIRMQRLVQKKPVPICTSESIDSTYDGLNYTEKLICFKTTGLYLKNPKRKSKRQNINKNNTELHILLKAWKLLRTYNVHLPKPGEGNIDERTAINDELSYDHMYFLPHSPLKFSNGERDHLYEQILINDPKAKLVFLEPSRRDATPVVKTILKKRWVKQNLHTLLGNTSSRYVWLPFVPLDMYIALGKLSNVVLDVCPNGMGVSAVEMLVSGTPFVATPYCKKVLRLSQGMYEAIGVTNMISKNDKEFLYLAHKLGTDKKFRTDMKQLVLEKVDLLFENDDVIDEWVDILKGLMLTAK